jgi:hypothetical protein
MGGYEPDNYDDVSNFLTFSDDEDDEEMSPRQIKMDEEFRGNSTPLSPPPSSIDDDDAIAQDDLDNDDLYANVPIENSVSASLASPVDPQWLLSSETSPDRHSANSDVSPTSIPSPGSHSDDKNMTVRRTALETIQERNEQLVKTSVIAKSSKSFPLLPDLLSLKQAEDEDEKMLRSEEGKRLNPKERRQLRNKVSARNFRVRRKGLSSLDYRANVVRIHWTS